MNRDWIADVICGIGVTLVVLLCWKPWDIGRKQVEFHIIVTSDRDVQRLDESEMNKLGWYRKP